MNPQIVRKIKVLAKERDLAKSVLPPFYQYHVEKEYRDSVVKVIKESVQLSNQEHQEWIPDITPVLYFLGLVGVLIFFVWRTVS